VDSPQLFEFGLGGDKVREIGVGVRPYREEVLVRAAALREVALEFRGAARMQLGQRVQDAQRAEAPIVDHLPELGCGAVVQSQVRLAAHEHRVVPGRALVREYRHQNLDCVLMLPTMQFHRRLPFLRKRLGVVHLAAPRERMERIDGRARA
jgi:hypothetical protein